MIRTNNANSISKLNERAIVECRKYTENYAQARENREKEKEDEGEEERANIEPRNSCLRYSWSKIANIWVTSATRQSIDNSGRTWDLITRVENEILFSRRSKDEKISKLNNETGEMRKNAKNMNRDESLFVESERDKSYLEDFRLLYRRYILYPKEIIRYGSKFALVQCSTFDL